MRPAIVYLGFLSAGFILFIWLIWGISFSEELKTSVKMAKNLEITDLCLFTEASYTRHPSQADIFAPFQTHLCAFDLFPSGAFILPRKKFQETWREIH